MKRKKYPLLAIVLFIAMTVCLNEAAFSEYSLVYKTMFGIAAAMMYALLNLLPFLKLKKPKHLF